MNEVGIISLLCDFKKKMKKKPASFPEFTWNSNFVEFTRKSTTSWCETWKNSKSYELTCALSKQCNFEFCRRFTSRAEKMKISTNIAKCRPNYSNVRKIQVWGNLSKFYRSCTNKLEKFRIEPNTPEYHRVGIIPDIREISRLVRQTKVWCGNYVRIFAKLCEHNRKNPNKSELSWNYTKNVAQIGNAIENIELLSKTCNCEFTRNYTNKSEFTRIYPNTVPTAWFWMFRHFY